MRKIDIAVLLLFGVYIGIMWKENVENRSICTRKQEIHTRSSWSHCQQQHTSKSLVDAGLVTWISTSNVKQHVDQSQHNGLTAINVLNY